MATRKAAAAKPEVEQADEQAPEVEQADEPTLIKVKSPFGAVTEVPESLVKALLDSGYSKTR